MKYKHMNFGLQKNHSALKDDFFGVSEILHASVCMFVCRNVLYLIFLFFYLYFYVYFCIMQREPVLPDPSFWVLANKVGGKKAALTSN